MSSRVSRALREKHPVKQAEGDGETQPDFKIDTQYLSTIQFEVTTIPEGLTEEEMIELSADLPCVEEIARDGIKTSDGWNNEMEEQLRVLVEEETNERNLAVTPSDPFLDKQWALLADSQWGIKAQAAWGESTGREFIVAVIDSGCDLHHPEVQGKLWVNQGELDCYNGIDDDGNGYVDDCYGWDWVDGDNNPSPRASGHGTGAAGIIASATNNAVGIAGICWFCQIMCLRFISGTEGKISNQVAAIDYAVKNGARISNNSYGGYGYAALEFKAIERARVFGHLFVTSAGNNNLDTDLKSNDHTPSVYSLDNILAVGASTQHGGKAAFSNFGHTSVDMFAPGASIQTVADGGRYAVVSGTSFAAPMAAGVAALLWSEFPNLNYAQVAESLIATCKLSPRLAGKAVCGGVLDSSAAIDHARKLSKKSSPATAYAAEVTAAAVETTEAAPTSAPYTPAGTHESNTQSRQDPRPDQGSAYAASYSGTSPNPTVHYPYKSPYGLGVASTSDVPRQSYVAPWPVASQPVQPAFQSYTLTPNQRGPQYQGAGTQPAQFQGNPSTYTAPVNLFGRLFGINPDGTQPSYLDPWLSLYGTTSSEGVKAGEAIDTNESRIGGNLLGTLGSSVANKVSRLIPGSRNLQGYEQDQQFETDPSLKYPDQVADLGYHLEDLGYPPPSSPQLPMAYQRPALTHQPPGSTHQPPALTHQPPALIHDQLAQPGMFQGFAPGAGGLASGFGGGALGTGPSGALIGGARNVVGGAIGGGLVKGGLMNSGVGLGNGGAVHGLVGGGPLLGGRQSSSQVGSAFNGLLAGVMGGARY